MAPVMFLTANAPPMFPLVISYRIRDAAKIQTTFVTCTQLYTIKIKNTTSLKSKNQVIFFDLHIEKVKSIQTFSWFKVNGGGGDLWIEGDKQNGPPYPQNGPPYPCHINLSVYEKFYHFSLSILFFGHSCKTLFFVYIGLKKKECACLDEILVNTYIIRVNVPKKVAFFMWGRTIDTCQYCVTQQHSGVSQLIL